MKEADGAPVDYPIRLELAHAFLNLAYTQLPLKQWQSSFEAYEKAMLLNGARHHAGGTEARGGRRGVSGATAPATDGDDDGEHSAGGDSSGQIQGVGTV